MDKKSRTFLIRGSFGENDGRSNNAKDGLSVI
jgi:hypothetical protein